MIGNPKKNGIKFWNYYEQNEHKMEGCPFCHKKTLEQCVCVGDLYIDARYYVRCTNCGAETPPREKQQDSTKDAKSQRGYDVFPDNIEDYELDPIVEACIPNNTKKSRKYEKETKEIE